MILNIGVNCQIDLNSYEEEGLRVFITGQSGSGKSYLAKVILEELADLKIPIIVIDPEGEYTAFKDWYSSLIIGGNRGDLSFEGFNLESAIQIVKRVYSGEFQILLFDTSDLLSSEQIQTHSLILEAVFKTASLEKKPCVLAVEEAHIIAPERGGYSRLLDLSMEVAKRGRKRGLHSIWVTQRPADISKKVISQCNIRFFGRHQEPADLNALNTYIRNLGLDENNLMNLNKEFIFYSKGEVKRIKARVLRIKDLGATPRTGLKSIVEEGRRLVEIKPRLIIEELKEEEVSFNVLKKQVLLREHLERLKATKRKYEKILDGILLKIDAGGDLKQLRVELQKIKNEIDELNKLERDLNSEYKRLPGEGAVQETLTLEKRLKVLEERRREGKISESAYLQVKKEYSEKLARLEEKNVLFKKFVEKQLTDLNSLSDVLKKELELLKAKKEIGELTVEDYELKEGELKKTLDEAALCAKFLKKLAA